MSRYLLWVTLAMLALTGCYSSQKEYPYLHYLAPPGSLEKGIVSKYYTHIKGKDGFSESTDIDYQKLELQDDTTLVRTSYKVDFSISSVEHFSLRPEGLLLIKKIRYIRKDSIQVESADEYLLGENEVEGVEKQLWPNGWTGTVHMTKPNYRDSNYNKEHYRTKQDSLLSTFTHPENKTIEGKTSRSRVYRKNLGLWEQHLENNKDIISIELVEQMSVESFEALREHGLHRVGYIDPEKSLTPDSSFALCGPEADIADYYNADPDAHYSSKDSLRSLLTDDLDMQQLKGESGYLTFRFVTNCKGETGRYTTEEADLNFVPKQFDPSVKTLLLERLLKTKNWQISNINGVARDTYVYVTYKLKDGKIIEILP